jgi:hypothetical protein
MSTARAIKTGWLEAYRPAGSFDAEVRRDADGEHVVWAQYLGDPEATALERARRIAVALEQENARLQQVVGFLLTNPLSRLSMTVYTSDIEAMAGRVTLTDDPATGKTTIGYQWRRDFLASPGGAS